MQDAPEVLVVCAHNAGRSVAARVLLDHHSQGRVVARSAGPAPADEINSVVAQVLAERGLDVSGERPKPLTEEAIHSADIIVTMGCDDTVPVPPNKHYLEWDPNNPAGRDIDDVRLIVDDIEQRVFGLLNELGIQQGTDARRPSEPSSDGR